MKKFLAGCALAALATSSAYAQSTGTLTTEASPEIIVTGTSANRGVGGIIAPEEPKARAVLTNELLNRKAAGASVLDTINLIPGVNFTNNDAYGSSGGNINIRGFDGARISLTFDGIPLNDTGNYAIYSNQQLDSELIEQVNVSLGSTDVDSPTASASGGTINYRTINPSKDFGVILKGSIGSFDYGRIFAKLETGEFTKFGTRAWFAVSDQDYQKFKGPGSLKKRQYNAKIYQPIGSNGDFISVAGHYNRNRNNNYLTNTVANSYLYPQSDYAISCIRPTPVNGTAQDESAATAQNCADQTPRAQIGGSSFGYYNLFVNPSNTGNVRVNSRFTLSDKLTLTVDPSWQYTLADGGTQQTTLSETSGLLIGGATPFSATNLAGAFVDLNGDGDGRDTVRVFRPSVTNTNRYGVLSSLIYNLTPEHRFRVAYSLDYGVHRQTGDYGYITQAGDAVNQFGGKKGPAITDLNGVPLQNRNRRSIAELNQVSGEYRGRFLDNKLTLNLGIRAPFFTRKLDQRCYTNFTTASITVNRVATTSGQILCTSYAVPATSGLMAPFKTTYKYNKVLPNAGATFDLDAHSSIFGSYSKGLSVPRTDNLYAIVPQGRRLAPETTDSFDAGYRYRSSKIQGQLGGWYIRYKNRIVSSYDRDTNTSIDTNIGGVKSYGADASLAYQPIKQFTAYAFGSYKHTKVDEDSVVLSNTGPTNIGGKRVVDSPAWLYGGRAQVDFGWISGGIDVKHTSKRFVTYVNDAAAPGYTLANLDVRVSLGKIGLGNKTFFQFNVINLFDKFYIGSIPTTTVSGQGAFVNVGAPRTLMGTFQIGF